MSLPTATWARIPTGLLLAGLGVGLGTLGIFILGRSEAEPADMVRQESQGLAFCLDSSSAVDAATVSVRSDVVRRAAMRVKPEFEAMNRLSNDKGLGDFYPDAAVAPEPRIVQGCPGGYVAPPDTVRADTFVRPNPVGVPSAFQVHVFLIADGVESDSIVFGGPFRRIGLEIQCSQDQSACGEVTTAVYVNASAAESVDTMALALFEALGLGETKRTLEALP